MSDAIPADVWMRIQPANDERVASAAFRVFDLPKVVQYKVAGVWGRSGRGRVTEDHHRAEIADLELLVDLAGEVAA